ncbi:DUF4198 domain-containing protein [Marivita sp.]|uniref:DUF4198 domain-containing protein n=1 Tax=Marivita sp. TaxID=2003365 RepID=UPI003F6EF838
MRKLILSSVIPVLFSAIAAQGHEVWIEPVEWEARQQAEIRANIYNGEQFDGFALSWNEKSNVRAEAWSDGQVTKLGGRLGDRPALATSGQEDGLLTLLYQSTYRTVDYDSYEKFASFVNEKGHDWVLDQHAERKLSNTAIKEAYSRFAKSLVSTGDGQGADAFRGMELELVALTNPYARPLLDKMSVRLFYQESVLPENRITVFERAPDGSVSTILLQSDQNGEADFTVKPGATYLVDAVVLREPTRDLVIETRGAVWESLWASLTFQVPDAQ